MMAKDAGWLKSKQVAFTGRLASMTRIEAADLVRTHGGEFASSVSKRTDFLVIGQEGWPLRSDGNLSVKIHRARRLQSHGAPLEILREEDFLTRLGLDERALGIHQKYTIMQLCRLLRVSRDRLRQWMRAGLVQPVETIEGVALFDFAQVTRVKSISDLTGAGVRVEQIRKSLEQLRSTMPEAGNALLLHGGSLVLRLRDGRLAEPSGQLHFDFDDAVPDVVSCEADQFEAGDWLSKAHKELKKQRYGKAVRAFQEALLADGPTPDVCFQMAHALYLLGRREAAAERYRQTVELDGSIVEAWNNLGNVLAELGDTEESLRALERAVAIDPHYSDARYNLADTLDQLGRHREAKEHYQAYLRLESAGPWADYARSRVAALELLRLR